MPQFWIAIFFILLAVAQLYQSIKDIDLPFPVYLVLGTVLAVAANAQHKLSFGSSSAGLTLPEIKQPDPALTSSPAPIFVATDTPALAPAQIEPKQPESVLKSVTLPSSVTIDPPDLTPPQLDNPKPTKKPRATRKTTPKPKQV